MFDGLRKKLAKAANEDEEIIFRPYEERPSAPTPAHLVEPTEENLAETPSLEGNNIELKVVRPESIDEIFAIADYLMDGCTVVLNLEVMTGDVVTRMLDFLNGVTYTTGGEIKNVSQGTYIITPNGINLNK
ncbi:MAG: cell division protein SepF [Clostridia bacterium]|nr:cell division protein SepF [Clostridia bacterium]